MMQPDIITPTANYAVLNFHNIYLREGSLCKSLFLLRTVQRLLLWFAYLALSLSRRYLPDATGTGVGLPRQPQLHCVLRTACVSSVTFHFFPACTSRPGNLFL